MRGTADGAIPVTSLRFEDRPTRLAKLVQVYELGATPRGDRSVVDGIHAGLRITRARSRACGQRRVDAMSVLGGERHV